MKHCDDCAPEFAECWNDASKCRKRLAPHWLRRSAMSETQQNANGADGDHSLNELVWRMRLGIQLKAECIREHPGGVRLSYDLDKTKALMLEAADELHRTHELLCKLSDYFGYCSDPLAAEIWKRLKSSNDKGQGQPPTATPERKADEQSINGTGPSR